MLTTLFYSTVVMGPCIAKDWLLSVGLQTFFRYLKGKVKVLSELFHEACQLPSATVKEQKTKAKSTHPPREAYCRSRV